MATEQTAGTDLIHGELDLAGEYRRLRDKAVVEAVVRTLRTISRWGDADRSPDELRVLAGSIERAQAAGEIADWCCLVCQEIDCDGDCPLEGVREHG